MYKSVPRSGVDNVSSSSVFEVLLLSVQEAVVKTKVCSKVHCVAPPTQIEHYTDSMQAVFFFVMLLCV